MNLSFEQNNYIFYFAYFQQTEECSKPCQKSKMEHSAKKVNSFQLLTISAKHSILDIDKVLNAILPNINQSVRTKQHQYIKKQKTKWLLTHSIQMHPFSTPWKHQKTLRFFYFFKG